MSESANTGRTASTEWRHLREQVFERDNRTCQHCSDTEDDGAELRPHHIMPSVSGGEDSVENLVTLCNRCHKELHLICDRGEYAPIEILEGKPLPSRETGLFGYIDHKIIDVLREGRATPRYLASRVDESRQLVSKRLRDLQMAGVTTQIDRGLYELNEDELEDSEQ